MSTITMRLAIIFLSYVAAMFLAMYFGALYDYLVPGSSGGSFIGTQDSWNWIIGYPLGLVFVLTFLSHSQGGKHVWWWNIIALAPAILFETMFDPLHIYFPIVVGLIAWGLGVITNKTLRKLAPSFMARIS